MAGYSPQLSEGTVREYSLDDDLKEIWRIYPVRISGNLKSPCHDEPTLLVQSMKGGFVTRNCPSCGEFTTLPERVFFDLDLWVACPECKKKMQPQMIDLNYAFVCSTCDLYLKLAALLPRWQDL